MALFKSPTWDVDAASEFLHRNLFGSGSKRKAKLKKQVSGKKLKQHLKSSLSQSVTEQTQQETSIRKDKEKFNKLKKDMNVSTVSTKKGVNKKKQVLPSSDELQNRSLQLTDTKLNKKKQVLPSSDVLQIRSLQLTDTKLINKQEANVCKSRFKENAVKNKNKHKLDRLISLKSNFKFTSKHKFVLPTHKTNSADAMEATDHELLNVLPQPKKHKVTIELGNAKKIKAKRRKRSLATYMEHENRLLEENGSATGAKASSLSQGPKVTKRDEKKPRSPRPQVNISSIDNFKIPTRRNPGTLRERMLRRLQASRFRYLNQQMYCSQGKESLEYFKSDPNAFQAYHHGYRQQVSKWPLNPLSTIINALKKKSSNLVVADFGCGDAQLASALPNTVHSFDLVALSEDVTVCDMAHTPLNDGTIDVAVFCLSLMGTNLADYLIEANRILKMGGVMKIAEVESRFEDVPAFIKTLMKYGFTITHKDLSHNLFYFMDFQKVNNIKKKKKSPLPQISLKPCLYKKR